MGDSQGDRSSGPAAGESEFENVLQARHCIVHVLWRVAARKLGSTLYLLLNTVSSAHGARQCGVVVVKVCACALACARWLDG